MRKIFLILITLISISFVGIIWFAGNILTAPAQANIGNCPSDLICENVEFSSESGSNIKGWFVKGIENKGVVVIMHGVRANRLSLIERMRFLQKAGFSILAFDFQSHGESIGKQITSGYLESRDATASLKFINQKLPNEKVGVIGISMGGAAFLLQKEPQSVEALILEMVYPTMQKAVENRLDMWLFSGARHLSPLLTYQFPLRLGVGVEEFRPMDKIQKVNCPVLFVVGEKGQHTTLDESREFFDVANQPKELWIVPNAQHQDLLQVNSIKYEKKILKFFQQHLEAK